MTGEELINWIHEHKAEDMEVFFLSGDGILEVPKPEIMENSQVKLCYWESYGLDPNSRSVIL